MKHLGKLLRHSSNLKRMSNKKQVLLTPYTNRNFQQSHFLRSDEDDFDKIINDPLRTKEERVKEEELQNILASFMAKKDYKDYATDDVSQRSEVDILRAMIKEAFSSRRGISTILKYYHQLIDLLLDLKDLNEATSELRYCMEATIEFLGENHISVFNLKQKLAMAHFFNHNFIDCLRECHQAYFVAYTISEGSPERLHLVKEAVNTLNYISFFVQNFYGTFSSEELKQTIFKIYSGGNELSSKTNLYEMATKFPEWRRCEMAERFLYDKLKKEEAKLSKFSLMSYKQDTKQDIKKQQDVVFDLLKKIANLFENEKRVKLAAMQYEKALTKAIDFYGKNSIQVGEILSDLSAVSNLLESYETGLSYAKRACVLLNSIPDKINKKHPEYEVKLAKALITIGEIYTNGAKTLPSNELMPYLEAENFISAGMNIVDKHYGRDHPMWISAAYSLGCAYDLLCSCMQETATSEKLQKMHPDTLADYSQLDIQVEFTEEEQAKFDDWRQKANNIFELVKEVIEMSSSKYLLRVPLTKGSANIEETMADDPRMFLQTTIAEEYPYPQTIHELFLSSRELHLLGSLEKGMEHLNQALELMEQQYGPETFVFEREFATTELANLYNTVGNIDQAVSLLETSLQRIEKAVGVENKLYLEVAHTLKNVASLKGLSEDQKKDRLKKLMLHYDKEVDKIAKEVQVESKDEPKVKETLETKKSSKKSTKKRR